MSNIQPYIILNGTDSRSISGLLISSLPPISKPQVRTQIETVDGRDGDIVTPLGFSAYDKVINIGLTYNYDVDEIIEFFNSEGIVTFSNEPDKYYRYAIYEQIDFERLIRFKTAEVTLHVQPFKFSTTEEPELFDVVSGQAIAVTNEGNTDSRPNLTIIGSGDIDVSLNGSQILSIELEDDQAVIIDSEDMNAYAAQSAIREVVADIEPEFDTNGYGSVWIGGAGKNLLNYDVWKTTTIAGGTAVWENNGVTLTATANDCFTRTNVQIPVTEGETITLSWEETTNKSGNVFIFPNGITTGMVNANNATNKKLSYTATSGITFVTFRFGVANSGDTIAYKNIQIEKGSTATAWTPYENIGEISGYNAAIVSRCGKNFFNPSGIETGKRYAADGQIYTSTVSEISGYIPVKPSTNMVLTWDYESLGSENERACLYLDFNKNVIRSFLLSPTYKTLSLSIPNDCYYLALTFDINFINIQLELGNQATDFKNYSGETYNIPFVDDQGDPITVYGGSLNVTTGELTVTKIVRVFDGSENFLTLASGRVFAYDFGVNLVGSFNNNNSLCSHFHEGFGAWDQLGIGEYLIAGVRYGGVNPNMTLADYKTYLQAQYNNGTPVTLVATLATPTEIQLTPTQINNLLGLNNMYTDNSGDLTVKHKSNGVIVTDTGDIVSFYAGLDDIEKGVLLNRAITGDYDKIRLRKGVNTFVLTGNAQQFAIDKFSRWL